MTTDWYAYERCPTCFREWACVPVRSARVSSVSGQRTLFNPNHYIRRIGSTPALVELKKPHIGRKLRGDQQAGQPGA